MQGIRHHKESFFHTRFWIVVLLGICIMLGAAVIKMGRKYGHAKSVRDEYQQELEQNKQHQADLKKNINALSTDRGKEEEIRDRYRVVKQGEQMILIVDNTQPVDSAPVQEQGIFARIKNWVKGLFH